MSDDRPKPKRRNLARRRGAYETTLATMRRGYRDPETDKLGELIGKVVDAQSEAKGGQPRELDPNFDHEIRLSLQDEAKAMLEETKTNPGSDAAKIVYIWVLNALATMKEELSPEGIKMLNEERARHMLLKQIVVQQDQIQDKDKHLYAANQKLNRSARHLIQAHDLAIITQRQLEEGKPVDMRGVCRRIAEIVGLAPPPQFSQGGQLNWGVAGGTSRAATEESDCANGQGDERDAK